MGREELRSEIFGHTASEQVFEKRGMSKYENKRLCKIYYSDSRQIYRPTKRRKNKAKTAKEGREGKLLVSVVWHPSLYIRWGYEKER